MLENRDAEVCLHLYYNVLNFRAQAAEEYFAFYACTTRLRFSSWSFGSVLSVLRLYYKVAISAAEVCLPRDFESVSVLHTVRLCIACADLSCTDVVLATLHDNLGQTFAAGLAPFC